MKNLMKRRLISLSCLMKKRCKKKKIKDWLDNRKNAILDKEKKDKENELSAIADMKKQIAQMIC